MSGLKQKADNGDPSRELLTKSRKALRFRSGVAVLAIILFVSMWSIGSALLRDDGLTTSGKIATWARNHHLGKIVDFAEFIRYRNPPEDVVPTELPSLTRSTIDQSGANSFSPPPVRVIHSPAIADEGIWQPVHIQDGIPNVWTTSIRPSKNHPAIIATHTLIDQTKLKAVLHNGTEVPGGRDWIHGNALTDSEVNKAVFAFNSAFRREHSGGGYYTEGKEVWPLVDGVASLAIDHTGKIHVGRWNRELSIDGVDGHQWSSVRQNLELLVIDGNLSDRLHTGYWGGGAKGEIYILRSAICERFDGRVIFTISGPTNATSLASTMKQVGCRYAMQLDQNESYPRGYIFERGIPRRIDKRMRGHDDDFIRGYSRDFIALLATKPE